MTLSWQQRSWCEQRNSSMVNKRYAVWAHFDNFYDISFDIHLIMLSSQTAEMVNIVFQICISQQKHIGTKPINPLKPIIWIWNKKKYWNFCFCIIVKLRNVCIGFCDTFRYIGFLLRMFMWAWMVWLYLK